jgi:monothiol glutaredoxin
MSRPLLDAARVHPAIQGLLGGKPDYRATIDEVERAVAAHAVVVVGMAQNPYPKKARALLEAQGVAFHYLEYGSYLSEWRRRLALKMWSGWSTLPMVFVRGTLIGGFDDLKRLVESGEFKRLVEQHNA